jgi:hypothetical protein
MGPLAKAAFTAAVLFIAGVILYGAAFVDNRAAGGLDGPCDAFPALPDETGSGTVHTHTSLWPPRGPGDGSLKPCRSPLIGNEVLDLDSVRVGETFRDQGAMTGGRLGLHAEQGGRTGVGEALDEASQVNHGEHLGAVAIPDPGRERGSPALTDAEAPVLRVLHRPDRGRGREILSV